MNDNFITEYFGIGIQNGKTRLGVLWRTAKTGAIIFFYNEIDTPNKLAIRIML
jgi:hypothetical protein